ncbi:Zn(2)-C6 fungal-type domain-containing protein [Mycena kentingensis (nom. inval.)]|nr:Zn(2)-C6 fungal-type domain-containing protein [Mycena kentingensis (nom. inval.)]
MVRPTCPSRGRKIRCDSNRPRCNNCVRRKNECIYDAVPKRRGPDKRPGTRQRSCKKRPSSASTPPKEKRDELAPPATDEDAAPTAKRRRVGTPVPCDELLTSPRPPTPAATSPSPAGKEKPQQTRRRASNASSSSSTREPERSAASAAPLPLRITTDFLIPSVSSRSNESTATPPNLFTSPSPRRPLAGVFMNVNVNAQSPTRGYSTPVVSPLLIESSPPSRKQMVAGPGSVSADQKAWWAGFLAEYALNNVISDLTFLFGDTGHLLSFLNLSALLQVLWSAEDRVRLPPAFVLAGLALAELMRSSEGERGAAGRARAAQWRQSAQTRLEFAISEGGSVDYRLAEAALILVVYETCAHPTYHPDRVGAALLVLDNLLNQLDLAQLDAHDPSAARFTPHSVPVVHVPPPPVLNPPPPIPQRPYALSQQPQYPTPRRTCRCSSVPGSPPPDNTVFCVSPPRWNPGWSAAETRAEECRRLVWCSLGAASGFMVQCAAFDAEAPVLRMLSDNSYALLFPGEFVDRLSSAFGGSDALSPKESLWALYCRSLLLWNFAHRLATAVRESPHALDPESDALHETWSEAAAIQESLELHVCNYDTGITYLCQEFVHNTRTSITQALRRINGFARELSTTPGPLFNRKQAVEWVEYQTHVVKRVKLALYQLGRRAPHIQQNALTRRPYLVGWFLNQFSVCMQIWTHDTELADAVALGKDLLAIMDVLNSWWPSDHNHAHTERLRKQLCHACAVVGAELPPYPTNTDLTLVRL